MAVRHNHSRAAWAATTRIGRATRFDHGNDLTDPLTPQAFDRLLALLSPDRERAAEGYERVRLKLIRFFEWRGARRAEELADACMDRVARKIQEGTAITGSDPLVYFYGVARNVLRESWADEKRRAASLGKASEERALPQRDEPSEQGEVRLDCLDRCLGTLSESNRSLILRYYQGRGQAKIDSRKDLAAGLSIPLNALRIRAHRVRASLESCIEACLSEVNDPKRIGRLRNILRDET